MMNKRFTKYIIIIAVIASLASIGLVAFLKFDVRPIPIQEPPVNTPVTTPQEALHTTIGTSVEGRPIDAYVFGSGKDHVEFVGGIHGGYEWNTVVLAYEIIDYFNVHPSLIPKNLTVTIVPSANPDGVFKITKKEGPITASDIPKKISTIPGRFNANTVDLNRNFDCKWQPRSTWQNREESAGTAPFSEPEALALKNLLLQDKPLAAVFWHSQSGNVYASRCEHGTLPNTLTLMNVYAHASGYKAVETFDAYTTTGGADDWLASIGIPGITVELTTHTDIEFEKNLEGVKALLEYYSEKN